MAAVDEYLEEVRCRLQLDVLDPAFAPGTNSPEPGGLKLGYGDMAVSGIDSRKVIEILKEFRRERLGGR